MKKKQLMIGLTARPCEIYGHAAAGEILDYITYLKAADPDILCFILPLVTPKEAKAYAEVLDGLCITGGEDLDPSFYGQEKEETTVTAPKEFDRSDLCLYHAFEEAKKPVFGICRGIQVINAAAGGDLIQDIPSVLETEHNQKKLDPPAEDGPVHSITTVPGTRLFQLFGKTKRVNSFHHQAIDNPAPGFTVSAYSPDGVIEGIEKNRVLAVQWHPERMMSDPDMIKLAALFLDDCRNG